MTTDKIPEAHPELVREIDDLHSNNREIVLLNLCTTDGFNICSYAADDLKIEDDKIAAIASTLWGLSESSSKQILKKRFDVTTVENEFGHMIFVSTTYLDLECVLTIAAKESMPLAKIRYLTKRLAQSIEAMNT